MQAIVLSSFSNDFIIGSLEIISTAQIHRSQDSSPNCINMTSLMLQLVLKWVLSDITAFMSVKHLLLVIKFKGAVLRQICFF